MRLIDVDGGSFKAEEQDQVSAIINLNEFLSTAGELSTEDRRSIVDKALFVLEEIYVHLPLKRAMHAIDPIQKLKLLRRRVNALSERNFHNEMIEIFKSLRDLHTNYILPNPYRVHTAFLPFLLEDFHDGGGSRRYVVSRMLIGFSHADFKPGVEVTHWSGVPIESAVAVSADREAGSNEAARHVRGLDAMTVRPMAMSLPPIEEWVLVGYVGDDSQPHELRLPWQVFRPDDAVVSGVIASLEESHANTAMGLDLNMELTNRARRALFVQDSTAKGERAKSLLTMGTQGDSKLDSLLAQTSFFPNTFEFRAINDGDRELGYIRIRTFSEPPPEQFISEVQRILGLLPQDGLIIDVRNNGGGIILNGERMLQLFTDESIEAERLHFLNTESTQAIADSSALGGFANRWSRSIGISVVTGAIYSQGFPIEPVENTNEIGRKYPGKVVVITDARCYSTTDIFAAGFQDNNIGEIIGVDNNTGAGGANVFTYNLLRTVLETTNQPLDPLPGGTDMRVAIRQTTRVKDNAGVPLEDLGVQPDHIHKITRNDILNDNVDLINAAALLL